MPQKKKKYIQIMPDPVYDSVQVEKFINQLMRRGKKTIARKVVYGAFDIVKEKTKRDPLEILDLAIKNAAPRLEVRPRRIGGATYQIPRQVSRERGVTLAMRWMIQVAKKGKARPMKEKLAQELLDASNNKGATIKKKNNIYRIAEANRAFAHFAW